MSQLLGFTSVNPNRGFLAVNIKSILFTDKEGEKEREGERERAIFFIVKFA